MDVRGVARFALIASLLLLVQAVVPTALAHGGRDHSQAGDGDEEGPGLGFPLTPDREFAEQRNPSMNGPTVAWQERLPGAGEDWEIVMADLSGENITVREVTNTRDNETAPVVGEDRIAWTVRPAEDPTNINLAVLDLLSGRIHHVPDSGGDEIAPTFAGNGTLIYAVVDDGVRHMRGFDLATGRVFAPIGDREIVGEPAAYGDKLAWAQGSSGGAKIHLLDTTTGEMEKATSLYNLKDGPEMGPAGVAWIARYGGEFTRGTYTTLWNTTTGIDRFQSNVYPHTNLAHCETGVIWDQPGTATTDTQAVALWDRYVEGTITFGEEAFSGACGADHLVYEQNMQGGEEEGNRQLYGFDLREVRLDRDPKITIDDDDRRSILQSARTVEGTAKSADPREPIETIYASIDGSPREEINATRTDDGSLAWEATIDPSIVEPGRHELEISVVDTLNRTYSETFTFYTETPYTIDPSSDGPNVPRQEEAPFPLNVLNHYQDHGPFYNTVALALLILAALGWYAYNRYTAEPTGKPEYVPPDEPEA